MELLDFPLVVTAMKVDGNLFRSHSAETVLCCCIPFLLALPLKVGLAITLIRSLRIVLKFVMAWETIFFASIRHLLLSVGLGVTILGASVSNILTPVSAATGHTTWPGGKP